jgi:hypothetical protein
MGSRCQFDENPDGAFRVPGPALHLIGFFGLPEKLQAYLDRKPEFRQYGSLPRASVADNTCRTITGQPAHLTPAMRQQLNDRQGFVPAAITPAGQSQLPPQTRLTLPSPLRGEGRVSRDSHPGNLRIDGGSSSVGTDRPKSAGSMPRS